MDCGVCANNFSSNNLPLLLQCGHIICSQCLEKLVLKVCPYDRIPIIKVEIASRVGIGFREERKNEERLGDCKLIDFCPRLHLLELTDIRNVKVVCNSCQNIINGSTWHCSTCNFDLCHHCKGEILCCSNHIMTNMPEDPYKCDGCLKYLKAHSKSCKICDIDLCTVCCSKYQKLHKRNSFCSKGHKMKWLKSIHKICELEQNRSYYTCHKCLKNFHKFGAFSCLYCKINTCLTCS